MLENASRNWPRKPYTPYPKPARQLHCSQPAQWPSQPTAQTTASVDQRCLGIGFRITAFGFKGFRIRTIGSGKVRLKGLGFEGKDYGARVLYRPSRAPSRGWAWD